MTQDTPNKLVVTLPSDTDIVMTRTFDAPAQVVFDCWTKPEHMVHWFGLRGSTLPVCEIDLRPGGRYRYVLREADGSEMGIGGEYREIEPPTRLVSTEVFDMWPDNVAVSTMVLEERDRKTVMTITTVYLSRETRDAIVQSGMEEGAVITFDRLDEYLATLA